MGIYIYIYIFLSSYFSFFFLSFLLVLLLLSAHVKKFIVSSMRDFSILVNLGGCCKCASCTKGVLYKKGCLCRGGQPSIRAYNACVHCIFRILDNQDLTWDKNISEICKRAYPRINMLSKLNYGGVKIEDLIEL